MKKIARRFGSSSYIQIVIRGITLLFATLALVSAQNAASPGDKPVVAQENVVAAEGAPVPGNVVAPAGLPVPVNVEEVDQTGMVPESPDVTGQICANYVVGQIGGGIVPGTADIGNHGDDVVTSIPLPFAFRLYLQTFNSITLSSNGNAQFTTADATFGNVCPLPWNVHNYTIFPYWDDLLTSGAGFGIFVSTTGVFPNRIFNIEWRTQYFSGGGTANFELRLYEGQESRFDIIYGTCTHGNASATAGVQRDNANFTQYFCNGSGGPATGGQSYVLSPSYDFNNDSTPDYVLYNGGTRQTAVWYMLDNVLLGSAFGPTLPAGWSVVGVADFNGDANPDYALFNASTGQSAIWYLSGTTLVGGAFGPTFPSGFPWTLVAVGDFNNDCNPDYVLYNASTGQTAVWYMNNNVFVSSAYGPPLPGAWRLVGAADFNRDGHFDYLLFNASTGQSAIWYLSGTTFLGANLGPSLVIGYRLIGAADFNGDGRPDYVLYNSTTGQTAIWYLNNNTLLGGAFGPSLPAGWSLVAP